MTTPAISLAYFHLFFIIFKCSKRNGLTLAFCVCALSQVAGVTATSVAEVEFKRAEEVGQECPRPGPDPGLGLGQAAGLDPGAGAGRNVVGDEVLAKLRVLYSTAGPVGEDGEAEGVVQQMPRDECGKEDETFLKENKYKDWIALFHYPYKSDNNHIHGTTQCQGVVDRLKTAMVFGASAIIILVLNPRIVKELDIAQLFSKPVILIQEVENITRILDAMLSKINLRAKINSLSSYPMKTFTVWSTCWRYKPGGGVVCRFDSGISKTDPGHFWQYFFSALASAMLLLMMKAKGRAGIGDDLDPMEQSIRRIALQALSVMQTKRYRPRSYVHDDMERDTCAICLELFRTKQRIRVLPCHHEYHVRCVDPWLLKHQTCPLCKLNIIDQQLKVGF